METISTIMLLLSAVLIGALWGRWFYRRVRQSFATTEREAPASRDLSLLTARRSLTEFLTRHGVTGDADIRDGKVLPSVTPTRLDPLALVLRNAHSMISQFPNAINGDLYFAVKNEGPGTGWRYLCTGVAVSDLHETASVMERVAEDRAKSRSLYKGITDDEMRSIVRAGMSRRLKAEGDLHNANDVMGGIWDDRLEFRLALAVVELLYQVKGASNG